MEREFHIDDIDEDMELSDIEKDDSSGITFYNEDNEYEDISDDMIYGEKADSNVDRKGPKIIFEGSNEENKGAKNEYENRDYHEQSGEDNSHFSYFDGEYSSFEYANDKNFSSNIKIDYEDSIYKVFKRKFIDLFVRSPYTVVNTLVGVIAGIMVLTVGFKETITMAVIVVLFNLFGQVMDRSEWVLSISDKIIRHFREWNKR